MPDKNYVGKGGHLAVMGEFLLRGYNVAMPEVDVGDDIFVVHDRAGTLWRIQVKTAIGKVRGYGYSGQFAVQRTQLAQAKEPDLFYVFALRKGPHWDHIVIPRRHLLFEQQKRGVGTVSGDKVLFNFRFAEARVLCSGRNFQSYRANWNEWPVIDR
jgi:hypothetical protein